MLPGMNIGHIFVALILLTGREMVYKMSAFPDSCTVIVVVTSGIATWGLSEAAMYMLQQ